MTTFTTVGASQTPSMTVSFKMDITTYGAHNGIFITSGIQQGTNGAPFQGFVAAAQGTNAITGASTPYPAITAGNLSGSNLNISGSQSGRTTYERLDVPNTSRSRPTTPVYAYGRDSPPNEFIEPENLKINVFEDRETLPYVQHPTDYVLNDSKTTTTTVEVFRSKVDRNAAVDFFELPPNPLGPDYRPQLVRAVGPPYEVSTQTETRFNDQPVMQASPGSRVQWTSQERVDGPTSRSSSRVERRVEGPPSRTSSRIERRVEGPVSSYTDSLERNRSLGGSLQSRPAFVDGDYQTLITRRQFSEKAAERIVSVSPSPSAGRVYPIPVERDLDGREPRALRQTVSHPDVFLDDYSRRARRRASPEYYPGYPRSRGTSPELGGYPLRRARSRSETRSNEYYPEGRPLSRAESWDNSVNNIFKLYQTRDCLGNIIQEL